MSSFETVHQRRLAPPEISRLPSRVRWAAVSCTVTCVRFCLWLNICQASICNVEVQTLRFNLTVKGNDVGYEAIVCPSPTHDREVAINQAYAEI